MHLYFLKNFSFKNWYNKYTRCLAKKIYVFFVRPPQSKFNFPKEIHVDGVSIQVVDKFRLLGVELDCNLSFEDFVSKQCLQINRKLYAIKGLFYLSCSVKVQFFKTFCLPYFDYCLTLSIYYGKTILSKLYRCYYAM